MTSLAEISNKIERWPFSDYDHVIDLIEFEGPLLVHYQKADSHAFYYWIEGSATFNTWLCFNLTLPELYDYLYGNITLLELIHSKQKEPFYLVDIDGDLSYHNYRLIMGKDIPILFLPDEDSYYIYDII
ncbi:MAG: hypothetical protein QG594_2430 [Bacteroidota bacterium]|nr:hypothetical protein [Bacteroidota bacterium]